MPKTPRPNLRQHQIDEVIRKAAGVENDPPPHRMDDWVYVLVLLAAGMIGLALYGLYIGFVTWGMS